MAIKSLFNKRLNILLFISLVFSINCFAQDKPRRVVAGIISSKTVALAYKGQIDTLVIPIASSAYPQLQKALSEDELFGESVSELVKEYRKCGCGITSLNYDITFLNKDILSITLNYESMGAHPDQYTKYIVLNIHTGKPYLLSDQLTPGGLTWALGNYKALMKKRILADKKDFGAEMDTSTVNMMNERIDELTVEDFTRQYAFTKDGIMFTIEQILPHVIRNMEPDRDWEVKYGIFKVITKPTALVKN
ncbi:hypothetical protein KXQ82_08115 [Mucilaginibacter sp. HMF5004]|uniref:hypothetical protein n=1 Tax=Mucilaginibacter rivuli TaxID=2857527 RepID=UPI001C5FB69A|nr:hypothetical protein [Mucilaginibacter rivuli]MBW4889677.1 hypothetical protein [Mucilaginibacter rivuli]